MKVYWLFLTAAWLIISALYAHNGNMEYSLFFATVSVISMGVHAILTAIEEIGK